MRQPDGLDTDRSIRMIGSDTAAPTPRPEVVLASVRRLAVVPAKVVFTTHARKRMVERGIDRIDVATVFARGRIVGRVEPGKRTGELKVKIVHPMRGLREVGVVTVVIQETSLVVLTVEWEDVR